jgi:large subunit ribosomal protein L23
MTEKTEKAAKEKKPRKAAKKTASGPVKARHYDIIRRPVITEKSTQASEQDKVIFQVCPDATKADVKEAVEALFKVNVVKVNTINVEGKFRSFRGRQGKASDFKKAIVTLEKGQKIDITAGAA